MTHDSQRRRTVDGYDSNDEERRTSSNLILEGKIMIDDNEEDMSDDDEIEEFDELDEERMQELSDRLLVLSASIRSLQQSNENISRMIHLIREESRELTSSSGCSVSSTKLLHSIIMPESPRLTKRARTISWGGDDWNVDKIEKKNPKDEADPKRNDDDGK